MPVIISAAVMHACGVAGIRSIVGLVMLVPALVGTGAERVVATLHAKRDDIVLPLRAVRERDGDVHAITITLADGGR
jgi:hypothetical protein